MKWEDHRVKNSTLVNYAERFGFAVEYVYGSVYPYDWTLTFRNRRLGLWFSQPYRRELNTVEKLRSCAKLPFSIVLYWRAAPDLGWGRSRGSYPNEQSAGAWISECFRDLEIDNGAGRCLWFSLIVRHGKVVVRVHHAGDGGTWLVEQLPGPAPEFSDPKGVFEAWVKGQLCDGELIDYVWHDRGWE